MQSMGRKFRSFLREFFDRVEKKALSFVPSLTPFEQALLRARDVQKLGLDAGFAFLPGYPDSPRIEICIGRYKDVRGMGIGLSDDDRALSLDKAVSEVVERSLWRDGDAYWNETSFKSTISLTTDRISLEQLSGYSHAERKARRSEFGDETEFLWCRCVRLDSLAHAFIPAQMVSGKYAHENNSEPRLREPNSNGLATADTFEEAAYRGLSELIERDAFMITFLNRFSPPRINPETITNPKTRARLADISRFRLENELLLIPTDMPLTVVCSVLRDPSGEGPALTIGLKAHRDPELAAYGAVIENIGTWTLARFTGAYLRPLPSGPLDSLHRTAFWAKRENTSKLSWLSEGPRVSLPRAVSPIRDMQTLAAAVAQRGCTAVAVEMAPHAYHKIGIHSACVVSPELQPINLISDTRYDGGERIKSVPEKLGYPIAREPQLLPNPLP